MNIRRKLAAWLIGEDAVRRAFEVKAPPPAPRSRISYEQFMAELKSVLGGPVEDPYRRKVEKIRLPEVPFKVERTPEQRAEMAMDDAGNFGFAGFLSTNTVAGAVAFGLYFPGYPYLAEIAQRSEYRQPTETTAKEMTRKWISLKSKGTTKKDERIKELEAALEEFKLQAIFRKATEHDGFYGLGHVFMDFKGQKDHALPLTIDSGGIEKGSLLGFKNIEPMWCTPLVWNSTDPTQPDFYKPTSWMVLGKQTHQARMLRFVSREVPDIIKPAYNFGGISLSQLIQPYVDRWLRVVDGVNRLILNFSIVNLRTDMDAVLSGGPSTELLKRMKLFLQTRDNQGLFISDKEAEELILHAVQLAGLSELQAQAQEHMAAPTHLPLVVLTGITPAGLNASSDSEIEVFHDWINSMQEHLYTDNLKIAIHVVMLHLWGEIDEDIVFDYVPLKQLTGEALSRVKKTQSEMDQTYVDMGAVDPMEVREKIARDPDSGYNNLSTTPPPELKEKNDAAAELAARGGEPPGEDEDEEQDEAVAA